MRFQKEIDSFCSRREYRDYELDADDWMALRLVANWLIAFRDATTSMSTTNTSVLSTTYAQFIMLQDKLRRSIAEIPRGIPQQLKNGLINAHQKLAQYIFMFNQSPYFLWATRVFISILASVPVT